MLVARLKGKLTGGTEYLPTEIIDLRDRQEHSYLVEAYCLDFKRQNPSPSDAFTFDAIDAAALAVLNAIPKERRTLHVIQAALWLWERIPEQEILERFNVSSEDMSYARTIVERVPPKER